jgi:predicted  nucleic acid-binding Zn-ribbon protein
MGALAMVCLSFFLYYNYTSSKIDALMGDISRAVANEAKFRDEIAGLNANLEQIKGNFEQMQKANSELTQKARDADKAIKDLSNKYAGHDMDRLTLGKPGLIEKIINKGTKDVFKEISDLTDPDNYEKDNTNNTPDND